MAEGVFLRDIETKYPTVLTSNRSIIEAMLIGDLWKDPKKLDDIALSGDQFITVDGLFYFNIINRLHFEHHLNELVEAAVVPNLTDDEMLKFSFKKISGLASRVSSADFEAYLDNFNKSNLLLKLYDANVPVTKPVQIIKPNGTKRTVVPVDECKEYDCQRTLEWFEAFVEGVVGRQKETLGSKVVESKHSFEITDEFLDSLSDGALQGTAFGKFSDEESRNCDGASIETFPWLDRTIMGLRHGTVNCLCGYSGSGKTMLMCIWLLGLISHGEKVYILSNEMDSKPYIMNFISFLAFKKFNYTGLTRNKMMSGDFTSEDKIVLHQVKEYFNATFAKNIIFDRISDSDSALVKKEIRYAALEEQCTVVFYDTMKADLTDLNNGNQNWLSLIRDSRMIDEMSKRYNLIGLVSIQIASSTKGTLWLDEGCISQSKQVIEIMETCLMLRNCYEQEELDESNKNYLNPFRYMPDPSGTYIREPYTPHQDCHYSLLFITKNRAGETSERTGEVLMLRANTALATFHESAWARPCRGFVGRKKN